MLRQINRAVWVAATSNRHLVIDCNALAFSNDFGKYFYIPNVEYSTTMQVMLMDSSVDKKDVDPYLKSKARCISGTGYMLEDMLITRSAKDIINSTNNVEYCSWITGVPDNIEWFIRVNKNVSRFLGKYKVPSPYVGIHFRNTDMKSEIDMFFEEVLKYKGKTKTAYLASDDYHAIDKFRDAIGSEFEFITFTRPSDYKGKSVHYSNANKDEVILTALLDMLILSKADYFVPTKKSSFSKAVMGIRDGRKFFT